MEEIRKAALELYKPPFRYVHGYIYDSAGEMVSDSGSVDEMKDLIAARVRGWGRIGYMENGAAIQDEMGEIMAEALTEYMTKLSGECSRDEEFVPVPLVPDVLSEFSASLVRGLESRINEVVTAKLAEVGLGQKSHDKSKA